jgi:asparaginyl-tRNA synthetase
MAGTDRRIPIRSLLAAPIDGAEVTVTGWIKTSRFSKNVTFFEVYDGSTPQTVQLVFPVPLPKEERTTYGIGTSIRASGSWVTSPGGGQDFEILVSDVQIVGSCDASKYPLQKKRTSLENLRSIAHIRPRTNTHQSVIRARNALSWQIHKYFHDRGFAWIHTPIITGSDCEGAGELFHLHTGDPKEHFFGKQTYLTVSGQLEVECFAQSHTDVYTFGPTFRAENSNTPRHVAEFWMIEPEMAFADLDDVVALAEDFVRVVANGTLAECPEDFDFFNTRIEKGVVDQVLQAISKPFARVTYGEAQDVLVKSGKKFEFPVGWGTHLQSEHERFLAEEHFKGPVFVTDYPIDQKAFYMRVNDDEKTVAATDLLMPRLGEILGGSQREERLGVLDQQFELRGIDSAPLWWYRDLRRWGTTPHGGFGLGLERMLMWMTGMKNIRDVIPFPRTPGSAEF